MKIGISKIKAPVSDIKSLRIVETKSNKILSEVDHIKIDTDGNIVIPPLLFDVDNGVDVKFEFDLFSDVEQPDYISLFPKNKKNLKKTTPAPIFVKEMLNAFHLMDKKAQKHIFGDNVKNVYLENEHPDILNWNEFECSEDFVIEFNDGLCVSFMNLGNGKTQMYINRED